MASLAPSAVWRPEPWRYWPLHPWKRRVWKPGVVAAACAPASAHAQGSGEGQSQGSRRGQSQGSGGGHSHGTGRGQSLEGLLQAARQGALRLEGWTVVTQREVLPAVATTRRGRKKRSQALDATQQRALEAAPQDGRGVTQPQPHAAETPQSAPPHDRASSARQDDRAGSAAHDDRASSAPHDGRASGAPPDDRTSCAPPDDRARSAPADGWAGPAPAQGPGVEALGVVLQVLPVGPQEFPGEAPPGAARSGELPREAPSGEFLLRVAGQPPPRSPWARAAAARDPPCTWKLPAGQCRSPQGQVPPAVEHIIPLVHPIVVGLDPQRRQVSILPPPGLLELGFRQCWLEELREELLPLCPQGRRRPGGPLMPLMPSQQQLLQAGRWDLVKAIREGGGLLTVARELGLSSRRVPNGFWENSENLEQAIAEFLHHPAAPESQGPQAIANHAGVSEEEPLPGEAEEQGLGKTGQDDLLTRRMPRRREVLAAGRYDLHHAIELCGGYKEVARQLGRKPSTRALDRLAAREAAGQQVLKVMRERGLRQFPRTSDLEAWHLHDLLHDVKRAGGPKAVAQAIGVALSRHTRGQWTDVKVAARAIKAYILRQRRASDAESFSPSLEEGTALDRAWEELMQAEALSVALPTEAELRRERRHDLMYILFEKYNTTTIAKELGLHRTYKSKGHNKFSTKKSQRLASCEG